MLPKFYIVKDEKDLVSGKIIPRKVLNYMPYGFGSINPTMSPVMLPKPIKTANDLTISPSFNPFSAFGTSPVMVGSPFLSTGPGGLSATSPFGSVEYKRIPLVPSYGTQSFGIPSFGTPSCGIPSYGTPCSQSGPLVLGPPVIKTSNMISQNIPGTVKIMAGNNVYSVGIPPNYIRNIANEINKYAAIVDSAGPLAQFRLITPGIDWTAKINSNQVFNFFDSINRRYPGLTYKLDDRDVIFNDLYGHLRNTPGYGYVPL